MFIRQDRESAGEQCCYDLVSINTINQMAIMDDFVGLCISALYKLNFSLQFDC